MVIFWSGNGLQWLSSIVDESKPSQPFGRDGKRDGWSKSWGVFQNLTNVRMNRLNLKKFQIFNFHP